jgi:hypothetical protein
MDNLKVSLATKPAWKDHMMALVGGAMYVTLPTAIERVFRVDLTGWRGYFTSITANLLIGGLCKSPGYMAGTLGAATAHLIYAKIQDPVFLKVFRKYAYRFDPTNVTSVMSDGSLTPQPLETRSIAGEAVHVFAPSPAVAAVSLEQQTPPPSGGYQASATDGGTLPALPAPTTTVSPQPAMADFYGATPAAPLSRPATLSDYASQLDRAYSQYTGGLSDAGYGAIPY